MTAVILAEPDLTGGPSPRMGVTLSGWSADGPVDVYRVHPDTSRHLVRGMSGVSGGTAFGWDYEAPFLVPVHYEADDAGVTVSSFGPVDRVNTLTNPSFETDAAGWSSVRGTLARVVDGTAVVGGAVLRYTSTDGTVAGGNYLSATVGTVVTPGDVWTGSGSVRPTALSLVQIWVQWFNGGTYVASTPSVILTDQAAGAWVRTAITDVVPPGVNNGRLFVAVRPMAGGTGVPVGGTFDIDAMMLEKAATLDAYFDGSTPADTSHGYVWQGAADASASESRVLDSTLDVDQVWVSAPGLPAYAVPVELVRKPSPARGRESTALRPMGRARPIVLSDVLGSPDFTVTLRTKTLNDADSLEQTVAAAGTLLLRIPGIRQAWQYVAATGLQEVPYTDYRAPANAPVNHPGNWTDWQLGGPVVDSPVGGVFGDPTASYQVLVDTYADYSAVLATEADYVDVLKGVVT